MGTRSAAEEEVDAVVIVEARGCIQDCSCCFGSSCFASGRVECYSADSDLVDEVIAIVVDKGSVERIVASFEVGNIDEMSSLADLDQRRKRRKTRI